MFQPQTQREQELIVHITTQSNDLDECDKTLQLLKTKFSEYETKQGLLAEENEYLKTLCRSKDEEIERLKSLNNRIEKDLQGANDALREMPRLQEKNKVLEERLKQLEPQMNQLFTDNSKLNNDNVALANEIRRLNDLIDQLDQEIEEWKKRCETAQDEADQYLQDSIKRLEAEFRDRLDRERQEQESNLAGDKESLNRRFDEFKKKIEELQARIALLITENERLNNLNYDQAEEIKLLRSRQGELEKGKSKDYDDMRVKIEMELNTRHNVRIANYENQIKALKDEIQRVDSFIRELQEKIIDQERRIGNLLNENSRLSDLAINRLKEIEELKKNLLMQIRDKNNGFGPGGYSATGTGGQGGAFSNMPSNIQELTLQFTAEKDKLQQDNSNLKSGNDRLKTENERLKELLDQRKKEMESLMSYTEGQRDMLDNSRRLEEELKLTRNQLEQTARELQEMRQTRDLYKKEYEALSKQNLDIINNSVKESHKLSNQKINNPEQFAGIQMANSSYMPNGSKPTLNANTANLFKGLLIPKAQEISQGRETQNTQMSRKY